MLAVVNWRGTNSKVFRSLFDERIFRLFGRFVRRSEGGWSDLSLGCLMNVSLRVLKTLKVIPCRERTWRGEQIQQNLGIKEFSVQLQMHMKQSRLASFPHLTP
jgi:hypothetical protein